MKDPLKNLLLVSALCGLAVAGAGCHTNKSESSDDAQPRVDGGKVVLPEGSPQLASLAIEPVQQAAITRLTLNGRLVWDENATVRIFTPFAGRVTRVLVEAGKQVKQGEPLALINSPDFGQAQADAHKAATDFVFAERALNRVRDLFDHGAAPQKDLDAAEADLARAKSERERTQIRLAMYGVSSNAIDQVYTLKSPVDGIVVEKNISQGQELRSDQMLASSPQLFAPLFVVTDPTRLWLWLDLNEHQLSEVMVGQTVKLKAAAYPEQTFDATVDFISDYLDPASHTVKMRAHVQNDARLLKAEMLVRAELPSTRSAGLNISSSAIFLRGDKHYVFVEEDRGKFARREIKVGPEQGEKMSVLSGVEAGQRVVTGNCLLLEEILSSIGG